MSNITQHTPGTPILITSHSHNAPFSCLFEDDGKSGRFIAATRSKKGTPAIEDSIILYDDTKPLDQEKIELKLIWSRDGEKAALLMGNNFQAIFNFDKKRSFERDPKEAAQGEWKRLNLNWSDEILSNFSEELFAQNNKPLTNAIDTLATDNSEQNRLALYKTLMKSHLIIPITAPDTDPEHKFITFPNDDYENLLCTFTDLESFNKTMTMEGIHYKKTPADFLFSVIGDYPVGATLITSNTGQNVLIDKTEYPVIAINKDPQSLSFQEKINTIGKLLIKPHSLPKDHPFLNWLDKTLEDYPIIEKTYLFHSSNKTPALVIGLYLRERDERQLVKFYKEIIDFQQATPINTEVELTVLEKGEYLLRALESTQTPYYSNGND